MHRLGLPRLSGRLVSSADVAAADAYAINGFAPGMVYAPRSGFYRKGGVTSDFASMLTNENAASSLRLVLCSDGVWRWVAHNLALNSATPATQSLTVVVGQVITVKVTGAGTLNLTGAGTGAVTAESPVTITATTTSLTLTKVGALDRMWAYRSDLGGMQDNPDTGDSYVPTGAQAVFMDRRKHHVYEGGEWVLAGHLVEPQGTNDCEYSEDWSQSPWGVVGGDSLTRTAGAGNGPDGQAKMQRYEITDTTNEDHVVRYAFTPTAGVNKFSAHLEDEEVRYVGLTILTGLDYVTAVFDLQTGTKTHESNSTITLTGSAIEDLGGGLYSCSITSELAASVTFFGITSFSEAVPTIGLDGREQYAGTAGDGFLAGYAQIEVSPVPSSYIPTAGSSVTRTADSIPTIAGADMPWDASNVSGSLEARVSYADLANAAEMTLFDWRADANNRITLTLDTAGANTGTLTLTMVSGGSSAIVSTTAELTPGVNRSLKVAWRCTDAAINIALDGTAETAVATAIGVPTLSGANAIYISGGSATIGEAFNFAADLGDVGLVEATA